MNWHWNKIRNCNSLYICYYKIQRNNYLQCVYHKQRLRYWSFFSILLMQIQLTFNFFCLFYLSHSTLSTNVKYSKSYNIINNISIINWIYFYLLVLHANWRSRMVNLLSKIAKRYVSAHSIFVIYFCCYFVIFFNDFLSCYRVFFLAID